MEEVTEEPAELVQRVERVERVAALDIGKATLVACVRVPHDAKPAGAARRCGRSPPRPGRCRGLADWLDGLGVTRVVMETGVHGLEAAVYLLEEQCERWLVNAREAKHVPGRPKTDKQDAVWLAKLPRAGHAAAELRAAAVAAGAAGSRPATGVSSSTSGPARPSVWSRLLEDAQIKLSVVAADIFGVSSRDMMAALIAGEPRPEGARAAGTGQDARQLGVLAEALTGHFRAHHGYLLRMMLDRIDTLGAQIN